MKDRERYRRYFGVEPPDELGKFDVWPMYAASFIRRMRKADVGREASDAADDQAEPKREAVPGQFGLIPHWATDATIARHAYNARSETVARKLSFRDAWRHGQRCIIPAEVFYKPDWRSSKAVPTRIARADGEPMGIAGLWSWWKPPKGESIHSFSMLTINAGDHRLMNQFHKATDEKRMVVILQEKAYQNWLAAPLERVEDFLQLYPADAMVAIAQPVL